MKQSKLGKVMSMIGLGLLTIGVMLFLGKHSLNFFISTFAGQDEIYAWLGLLLTSGGAVIWLYIFLNLADTPIRKAVTLIMMAVALIGEFATAGFDMYMTGAGVVLAPEDIKMMSTVVAGLGLLAGGALVAYAAGDAIVKAFADDDGDGIPNAFDKHDNRKGQPQKPVNVNALEARIAELRRENEALKSGSKPQQAGQGKAQQPTDGKDTAPKQNGSN